MYRQHGVAFEFLNPIGTIMRNLLLSASLGALLLAAPLASHATNNGDLFINGSVGTTHSDVKDLNHKDDTGYGVNFGYRWNDTWGLETGYVDLGKPYASMNIFNQTLKAKLHVTGWTLGANGKFNFGNHWFVSARGGVFFSNTKLTTNFADGSLSAHDTNIYAGLGGGYNFNKHLSIGLNFDRYLAKAKNILDGTNHPYMVSGTLEYRFGI